MPHILIPGIAKKREIVLNLAKEMGLSVTVLDESRSTFLNRHDVKFVKTDLNSKEAILKAVESIHAERPIDAVVPVLDRGVLPSAWISKKFGFKGNSESCMKAARHKGLLRSFLAQYEDLGVHSRLITSLDELRQAALDIGYPLILKPAGGTLSIGVFKIRSEADLETAFVELQRIANPKANSIFHSTKNEFVVEQFLEGPEFSVEGVSSNGIAQFAGVTEKWKRVSDFVETKHLFPARLSTENRETIIDCAARALQAIGWKFGGFHVEVILTQRGPRIVEINGRLGGDYISTHLVPLASGINIWRENLLSFLGERVHFEPSSFGHACVAFKVAESSGTLHSIEGNEAFMADRNAREFFQEIPTGNEVSHCRTSSGEVRLAAVITLGASSEDALRSAEIGLQKIQVTIG